MGRVRCQLASLLAVVFVGEWSISLTLRKELILMNLKEFMYVSYAIYLV